MTTHADRMSHLHTRADRLVDERDELDVPMIPLDSILLVIADHAPHSGTNLEFIRDLIESVAQDNLLREGAGPWTKLALDMIDEALESSTQEPHVIRAAEISEELRAISKEIS